MKNIFKILWKIVFIVLYPFITLFSLFFTGVILLLSHLSAFLARLSAAGGLEEEKEEEWQTFLHLEGLQLSKRKIDEVLFGPPYFQLNASPRFPDLQQHVWGQFHFTCFEGALLQKWHSVKEHELEAFDLVYIDPVRRRLKKLCTLPTYDWEVRQLDAERVLLEWFNGKERMVIRAADLV